jgi:hypothetical protein
MTNILLIPKSQDYIFLKGLDDLFLFWFKYLIIDRLLQFL